MRKKVWIFGDSYAQLEKTHRPSWPLYFENDPKYDVTNFALGGTGPNYSLNLLKEQLQKNTEDVTVIFFISAIWRLDLKFLEKGHQHILVHLDDELHDKKYKRYKAGIRFFLDHYVMEDSFRNVELDKVIGILKLYSEYFENMLVWPVFHETDTNISNTNKFTLNKEMLFKVEPSPKDMKRYDKRVNHLSTHNHDKLYKQLCNFVDNGTSINMDEFT